LGLTDLAYAIWVWLQTKSAYSGHAEELLKHVDAIIVLAAANPAAADRVHDALQLRIEDLELEDEEEEVGEGSLGPGAKPTMHVESCESLYTLSAPSILLTSTPDPS